MSPPDDTQRIDTSIRSLRERLLPMVRQKIPADKINKLQRAELAQIVRDVCAQFFTEQSIDLGALDQRDLITALINGTVAATASGATAPTSVAPIQTAPAQAAAGADISEIRQVVLSSTDQAKLRIQPLLMERIDTSAAAKMDRTQLAQDVTELVKDLMLETRIQLNAAERVELVNKLLDDMLGLGPLEPLLAEESISEIMVNGPKSVYVEQRGKLTLTNIQFRDNAHVLGVATRIVTTVGRRIDETTPLCDARLLDGSRVNIIIPPLAIDGPTITIRKFSKKKITLDTMTKFNSISPAMATLLQIAGRARCNIIISGGTGSGKTTLLNALSQMIDHGERIVTIEDAAELQLQQPHVVRLETRPANLEGHGEITMRDLLKNALRMRPDRIIVGETRSGEAIDMLQAMNTGHDGSLSTVHANRPREALMRLENMVGLAGVNLAPRAIRMQIASAVDMIIQVSRMRDGSRRITYISEITGMEGDVITMQDLFTAEVKGEGVDGKLQVEFVNHGLRPHFLPKAQYFNLDRQLLEVIARK
jgi:pilus assembly protein CpaF